MNNKVNRAQNGQRTTFFSPVVKKLSFKTLTLIAAIGMSAAALFFGAEYAMSQWLGMWYITLGSLAFRIVRHLFIVCGIIIMKVIDSLTK